MTCMIGIAGNIIPAIATTNAIIASIQVQQAINVIININKNTSTNTTTTASTEEDVTNAAVTPSSSSPSSSSIAAANQIKCSHVYCLRLPTRKGYLLSSLLFYLTIYLSSIIYHLSIYLSMYLSIRHFYILICLSFFVLDVGYYLQPCTADKPVPSCYVCGTAEVHLQV